MTGRPRSWTDAQLIDATESCRSIAEIIRLLGLKPGGGTQQHINHRMQILGIALREHDPWAWMREPGANTGGRQMPLSEALTSPSPYMHISKLRKRLIGAGLKKNQCEECGIGEWMNKPLTCELDHIDGNRSNNRLENLRMLCPNCHAQTETWCRRMADRPT
jgi:HNH endonuclease